MERRKVGTCPKGVQGSTAILSKQYAHNKTLYEKYRDVAIWLKVALAFFRKPHFEVSSLFLKDYIAFGRPPRIRFCRIPIVWRATFFTTPNICSYVKNVKAAVKTVCSNLAFIPVNHAAQPASLFL